MNKRVIINADDFGWSAGVSEGILRAHREGVVTSATMACNMPAAAEAVRLLADAPRLGVGVHLNVSQGPPLSHAGRRLAADDGLMDRSAMGVILDCATRPWALSAVRDEFEAQIRWALDHGVRPTHLDSHRHCHAFAPIFARVVELARRYNIPFVRRLGEPAAVRRLEGAPAGQRRLSVILNCNMRIDATITTDCFATGGTWGVARVGGISSGWLCKAAVMLRRGVTEIMTHPGNPAGLDAGQTRLLESRRRELEALCEPAVADAFRRAGVELVNYGDIADEKPRQPH